MDLLTRIEASLEFMNDGGPIRVDLVNLREVLEGSREALLKLGRYRTALERIIETWDGDSESMHDDPAVIAREALSDE